MMHWRRWGIGLMVLLLSGCASGGGVAPGEPLKVGQRESDLVAQKGQPLEVRPGPNNTKIYVYAERKLDQVAILGGGAWSKPDEVHYWLNDQGVITRVSRYPYGKKKFLFPTEEAAAPAPASVAATPGQEVRTGAAPGPPSPAPVPTPVKEQPPRAAGPVAAPAPSPPAPVTQAAPQATAPARGTLGRPDMSGAVRLELNQTREEVQRLLGLPERTEGFRVRGRAVIVWFYQLTDPQGRRVSTPVVFENGRVSGWGESHYRRLLKEALEGKP